jgi:hypothetical protein
MSNTKHINNMNNDVPHLYKKKSYEAANNNEVDENNKYYNN